MVIVFLGLPSFKKAPEKFTEAQQQVSLDAFAEMVKVIKHPRCMNCHPAGDRPNQSDKGTVHVFNVKRGADNQGSLVMRCTQCHQKANNEYTNVPGAPHWQLAPKSMGWQGLTDAQIGANILDQTKNGGRTIKDLVHHMTQDSLVAWAWNPGKNRSLPPLNKTQFNAAVEAWANNGAFVPKN